MPENNYRRDLMGHVTLSPSDPILAGTWTSLTFVYTAGRFGIDDLGGLKLAMRTHNDMTPLQTTDPSAPGYLTAVASNGATIDVDVSFKRNIRPWGNCVTILAKHFLSEGDTITLVLGDRSGGSKGIRAQTFAEEPQPFRLSVDAFATCDFIPLPEEGQPSIDILPGDPVLTRAILPTLRRPGEKFRLVVKAEDRWGNPTDRATQSYALRIEGGKIEGLPDSVSLQPGQFGTIIEGLSVEEQGEVSVILSSPDAATVRSNPLRIAHSDYAHYWSDMHAQSGETIGAGSARDHFTFARDKAFVDITAHQGNDFQITDEFWAELNELTKEFEQPGAFLAIPGYEWSGNTSVGGDHNVWYRHEGREIYRSSRALVDVSDKPERDCNTVKDLFAALQDEDVLVVPHVGGRYADVSYAHDAALEPSVEVHSSWGTFDWILTDSLALGHRVGVVAGSDDHKGRPGASHPGVSKFGSYGGLTCHLLPALDRDSLFSAFRRRRHYATSGTRAILLTSAEFETASRIYDRNPALSDSASMEATTAMMGDIVATGDKNVDFTVEVSGSAPIDEIQIRSGLETVERLRPNVAAPDSRRIRVICSGQENRGRGRLVNWSGKVRAAGCRIARIAAINFYNPDRQPQLMDDNTVDFVAVTTGGFSAIDIWLEDVSENAQIEVDTNLGTLGSSLSDLTVDGMSEACGGLDKALRLRRMPDNSDIRSVKHKATVAVPETGDAALYARITFEDGHVAWSSPIYVFRT